MREIWEPTRANPFASAIAYCRSDGFAANLYSEVSRRVRIRPVFLCLQYRSYGTGWVQTVLRIAGKRKGLTALPPALTGGVLLQVSNGVLIRMAVLEWAMLG